MNVQVEDGLSRTRAYIQDRAVSFFDVSLPCDFCGG
jgi:hypothetical protein